MKNALTSPKFLTIAIAVIAIVGIPLTILQVQNQQNIKQEASGTSFSSSQSATVACGANGFDITVKIKNTSSSYSSNSFDAQAKDNQSGVIVNLGTVQNGNTVTGVIHTGKTSMKSGTVTFILTKAGSYSNSTSKSADYSTSSGGGYGYGYNSGTATCSPQATPTPTPLPYGAPTPTQTPTPTPLPYGVPTPTPTICPTLGPVKNVHIDCPNCAKKY